MSRIPDETKVSVLEKILDAKDELFDPKKSTVELKDAWESIAQHSKKIGYNKTGPYLRHTFIRNQKAMTTRRIVKDQKLARTDRLLIEILGRDAFPEEPNETPQMPATTSAMPALVATSNSFRTREESRKAPTARDHNREMMVMAKRKLSLEIEKIEMEIKKAKMEIESMPRKVTFLAGEMTTAAAGNEEEMREEEDLDRDSAIDAEFN